MNVIFLSAIIGAITFKYVRALSVNAHKMISYSSDEDDHHEHFYAQNPHQRRTFDRLDKEKASNEVNLEKSRKSGTKRYTVDPDPEVLDSYDFFYKTTKSLLVLFQIMGVMPIERSGVALTTFR